jgi:hypothetical protein
VHGDQAPGTCAWLPHTPSSDPARTGSAPRPEPRRVRTAEWPSGIAGLAACCTNRTGRQTDTEGSPSEHGRQRAAPEWEIGTQRGTKEDGEGGLTGVERATGSISAGQRCTVQGPQLGSRDASRRCQKDGESHQRGE